MRPPRLNTTNLPSQTRARPHVHTQTRRSRRATPGSANTANTANTATSTTTANTSSSISACLCTPLPAVAIPPHILAANTPGSANPFYDTAESEVTAYSDGEMDESETSRVPAKASGCNHHQMHMRSAPMVLGSSLTPNLPHPSHSQLRVNEPVVEEDEEEVEEEEVDEEEEEEKYRSEQISKVPVTTANSEVAHSGTKEGSTIMENGGRKLNGSKNGREASSKLASNGNIAHVNTNGSINTNSNNLTPRRHSMASSNLSQTPRVGAVGDIRSRRPRQFEPDASGRRRSRSRSSSRNRSRSNSRNEDEKNQSSQDTNGTRKYGSKRPKHSINVSQQREQLLAYPRPTHIMTPNSLRAAQEFEEALLRRNCVPSPQIKLSPPGKELMLGDSLKARSYSLSPENLETNNEISDYFSSANGSTNSATRILTSSSTLGVNPQSVSSASLNAMLSPPSPSLSLAISVVSLSLSSPTVSPSTSRVSQQSLNSNVNSNNNNNNWETGLPTLSNGSIYKQNSVSNNSQYPYDTPDGNVYIPMVATPMQRSMSGNGLPIVSPSQSISSAISSSSANSLALSATTASTNSVLSATGGSVSAVSASSTGYQSPTIVSSTSSHFRRLAPILPMMTPTQNRILDLATKIDPENMPEWLGSVVDKGPQIIDYLLKLFGDIETEQKTRIEAAYDSSHPSHPYRSSVAHGSPNNERNRYQDIVPFDYNRVVLKTDNSGHSTKHNDYINASIVTGLPGCEQYIVCQGPLPHTSLDFWQMNWENDINLILMLTREEEKSRIKCHKYWPTKVGKSIKIQNIDQGDLIVTLLEENMIVHDTTLRRVVSLQLVDGKTKQSLKTRSLVQLQFLGWPDFQECDASTILEICDYTDDLLDKARADGLLSLLNETNVAYTQNDIGLIRAAVDRDSRKRAQDGSFVEAPNHESIEPALQHVYDKYSKINFTNAREVVHCSAGCGRSGTFCTIDSVISLMRKLNTPGSLDLIRLTVRKLREQRISMVQAFGQYVLIYEAILLRIYQWQCGQASEPPQWIKIRPI